MRWLRSTYWSPELKPTTVVVSEADVTVPLDEISVPMETAMFVKDEIFELADDVSVAGATLFATELCRKNLRNERNQAIMYYWIAMQFQRVRERGVIASPKWAPLSVDEMKAVHKQLIEHPHYRDQTLLAFAEDGTPVERKPHDRN